MPYFEYRRLITPGNQNLHAGTHTQGSPNRSRTPCPVARRACEPYGSADPLYTQWCVLVPRPCAVLATVFAAHIDRRRAGIPLQLKPALALCVPRRIGRITDRVGAEDPRVTLPMSMAQVTALSRALLLGIWPPVERA